MLGAYRAVCWDHTERCVGTIKSRVLGPYRECVGTIQSGVGTIQSVFWDHTECVFWDHTERCVGTIERCVGTIH